MSNRLAKTLATAFLMAGCSREALPPTIPMAQDLPMNETSVVTTCGDKQFITSGDTPVSLVARPDRTRIAAGSDGATLVGDASCKVKASYPFVIDRTDHVVADDKPIMDGLCEGGFLDGYPLKFQAQGSVAFNFKTFTGTEHPKNPKPVESWNDLEKPTTKSVTYTNLAGKTITEPLPPSSTCHLAARAPAAATSRVASNAPGPR